jgi:MbeD/MobD like
MAPERSLLRQYFDSVERSVGRPLESGVETDTFQDTLAAVTRLQAAIKGRLERASGDLLHMFNLPAHSDMKRLSEQVSRLDKQVRDLSLELEKRSDGTQPRRRRR